MPVLLNGESEKNSGSTEALDILDITESLCLDGLIGVFVWRGITDGLQQQHIPPILSETIE